MNNEAEDPKRRLLVRMLAAGLFSGAGAASNAALAQFFWSTPAPLAPGRSVYRVKGKVQVDGKPATLQTRIGRDSRIETGGDGEIVYAVGQSAFIARANTQVIVETGPEESLVVTGLRLLAGKLLSVFPSGRPVQIRTKVASVGIRGTGVYLESDPEQTYFCTCYGVADVAANADPESRQTVVSMQHDQPLYILANAASGRSIRPAPVINHTDEELILIEALVGREPPFVFPGNDSPGYGRR